MNNHIKVIVVEDEMLLANSLVKNIENANRDFKVVNSFYNGQSALASIPSSMPDVVFTDLKMPMMNGLELIRIISAKYPQIKTVIISGYNEFDYVREAFKYKSFDYLLKPVNQVELSDVLLRLHSEFYAEKNEISPLDGMSTGEIVETVKIYLMHNYDNTLNLSDIAEKYSFSQSYLSKIFKVYEGIPPIKFLNHYRMTVAKKLLAETSLSIKIIAKKVGIPDQFHFSKQFKSTQGCSPSTYRAEHAASQINLTDRHD